MLVRTSFCSLYVVPIKCVGSCLVTGIEVKLGGTLEAVLMGSMLCSMSPLADSRSCMSLNSPDLIYLLGRGMYFAVLFAD